MSLIKAGLLIKRITGMNLQQTIAELEKQAQQYLDAANALRALQANGAATNGAAHNSPAASALTSADSATTTKPKQTASGKKASAKANKSTGQKRYVSPETRAKIAAAIKARHAARKAAAA